MAATRTISKTKIAKSVAAVYQKPGIRTEPLSRLVDFLDGVPAPAKSDPELLIGRAEWASYDTRKANRAVGFFARTDLVAPHSVRPPMYYSRTAKNELFDATHADAIKTPKIAFRFRETAHAAMLPKNTLPVEGTLLCVAPRLKTTPTEDLPVILSSRWLQFYWRYFHRKGKTADSSRERLEAFEVPMLTKRTGGPFRRVRDRILKLGRENTRQLGAMDEVQEIADGAGVQTIPIGQTEGIIREINVPKPLAAVAEIRRRGPVVIFRRGSTIVTTTEEAATYLELWLQNRFDLLRGLTKEELEDYIRMPLSTAHVVEVLQSRAQIETEIEQRQREIEELQSEADELLGEALGLDEDQRTYLLESIP